MIYRFEQSFSTYPIRTYNRSLSHLCASTHSPSSNTHTHTTHKHTCLWASAGVKVWMITGDRIGTACNIALACRLLQPPADMRRIELTQVRV